MRYIGLFLLPACILGAGLLLFFRDFNSTPYVYTETYTETPDRSVHSEVFVSTTTNTQKPKEPLGGDPAVPAKIPQKSSETPVEAPTPPIKEPVLPNNEQNPPVAKSSPRCETPTEKTFYLDPTKSAVKMETSLRSEGRNEEADLIAFIACEPQAIWLNGNSGFPNTEIIKRAINSANGSGKIPVFVIYNIPGHHDAIWRSGIGEGEAYKTWVRNIANAIGDAEAWIILEPDALLLAFDYSAGDRQKRYEDLRAAVQILKSQSQKIRVYIDAGHSNWKPRDLVASALHASGIERADGFSVNVSNFQFTDDEVTWARTLSQLIGGKPFVVDTSRNGKGPAPGNDWCNPWGRGLGLPPQRAPLQGVDAYLWVKSPGESDGTCAGGPTPGKFWLEYALDLARNRAK